MNIGRVVSGKKKKPSFGKNAEKIGEFLLDHKVDSTDTSHQPRGLKNGGNYCYLNSTLQALTACPPLSNLFKRLPPQSSSADEKILPIIDAMCRYMKSLKEPANVKRNNDLPFEASCLFGGALGKSLLVEGRQEDAQEFLCCLLNGLNTEMLQLMKLAKSRAVAQKKPKNATRSKLVSPIGAIFGGTLKSTIHRTGDRSSENFQPFLTLPLDTKNVRTVGEALDAWGTKNRLEGLRSEETNQVVEAFQQMTLDELPVVLVLHLKCFDFNVHGSTKIVKALEFPLDLTIGSNLLTSKMTTPGEKSYKLFAVLCHHGKSACRGHYTTDALHNGNWMRYDDASVRSLQESHVLNPQGDSVPYLLFYRRSDTITSKF